MELGNKIGRYISMSSCQCITDLNISYMPVLACLSTAAHNKLRNSELSRLRRTVPTAAFRSKIPSFSFVSSPETNLLDFARRRGISSTVALQAYKTACATLESHTFQSGICRPCSAVACPRSQTTSGLSRTVPSLAHLTSPFQRSEPQKLGRPT